MNFIYLFLWLSPLLSCSGQRLTSWRMNRLQIRHYYKTMRPSCLWIADEGVVVVAVVVAVASLSGVLSHSSPKQPYLAGRCDSLVYCRVWSSRDLPPTWPCVVGRFRVSKATQQAGGTMCASSPPSVRSTLLIINFFFVCPDRQLVWYIIDTYIWHVWYDTPVLVCWLGEREEKKFENFPTTHTAPPGCCSWPNPTAATGLYIS